MGRIRTLSEEVLSKGWSVLTRYRIERRTETGQVRTETREVYDRGNAAAILLFDRDLEKLVLTRQFRLAAFFAGYQDDLIEVAAGMLDGEDPEAAIIRECEEETGYRPGTVVKVGETLVSPGSVSEIVHLYFAEVGSSDRVSEGGGVHDEGEDIEVLLLAPKEALDMVETGAICDAKTVILLQWFRLMSARGPGTGSM